MLLKRAFKIGEALGALKGTELRLQREPKTQIFAENRRFSQIRPFPDLLFLVFLENGKENHQKSKDFLSLPDP